MDYSCRVIYGKVSREVAKKLLANVDQVQNILAENDTSECVGVSNLVKYMAKSETCPSHGKGKKTCFFSELQRVFKSATYQWQL